MSFQVYVNNIAINDEPMGLTEATVKIMRDEQFSGIVSNIVSDLSFWGDGYDIIYGLFQSTTGCLDIPIRIEQTDCLGFIFEGIIFLADIELDISRCIAKCTLSDNSLSSLIGRNYDVQVPVHSNVSLNGTPLTGIGELLFNPNYAAGGTGWPWPPNENPLNPEGVDGAFKWFGILELYEYISKYFLNDDSFTVSDLNGYLTNSATYFEPDHWTIQIDPVVTYSGVGTPTCDVSYNDAFGNQITRTINLFPCDISFGYSPLRTLFNIREVIQEHFVITSINPFDGEWRDNYCNRAMAVGDIYYPGSGPTGRRIMDVYFPWDAGNLTVGNFQNITTGAITITKVNAYNYGPYYARVTSGKILKNWANPASSVMNGSFARGAQINVSFADLMSGFGKLFNLGIKFGITGTGDYTMTIGKESDLYETTEAFAIDMPYEVMLVKDNKFGISSLKIGRTNTNPSFNSGIQEEASYVSNVCSEQDFDASVGFQIPTVENLVTLDGIISLSDDQLYVAEKDPVQYNNAIVGNYYKIASHLVTYTRRDPSASYCPILFRGDMVAGIVNHPEIARAYAHRSGDGFSWNGNFIPNNSGAKIRNRVTFEAPITVEQFNLIQANPYQKIRFGTGLYETGWVMSLEYNITSGMTKFELLTE